MAARRGNGGPQEAAGVHELPRLRTPSRRRRLRFVASGDGVKCYVREPGCVSGRASTGGSGSAAPASGVRWPQACPAGHRGGLLPPFPSRVLAAEPTRGYSGEHHMYASKLFLQSPDLQ